MAKPKFYLDPRPGPNGKQAINMYYSIGGGMRLQYYTGIRIEAKYFRPECNSSNTIKPIKNIAPYADQDNNKLLQIANNAVTIRTNSKGKELSVAFVRAQLDQIHKPRQSEPTDFKHTLTSLLTQIIDDSLTGRRLISKGKNKGSRYSKNSIKNYGVTLSAINRFMNFTKVEKIPLEDVTVDFYNRFRDFCYNVEKKEKSTFAGYIKDIKTVMDESKISSFETKDFIMPTYESDTIYLNNEQIKKIEMLDLSDSSKSFKLIRPGFVENIGYQTLDRVRDLFLIGCFTGLRFLNFNTLNSKNINGNLISVKQVKTGDRVSIPIMSRLRPVIEKYPERLPTISNQKFNDYIKCVAQLAGLDELITIKNTKGNIINETTHPLHSLITSHCCRRSYATNMFKAGIPPMLIMAATGHKTESNFLKYIRATNEDKANLLAEAIKKLGL